MRAEQIPVADFCIRAGCVLLCFRHLGIERPQYSCNLVSVSRSCVLSIEKPSKKFAPEIIFRRKGFEVKSWKLIRG